LHVFPVEFNILLSERKKTLKFKDIGEFGFIESIKDECITSLKGVVKGIGDDCAVFGPYSGRLLLFTTDTLVEDIHFLRDKVSPYQLGRKAIAVNLSDIAAMGGRPLFILVSLVIPVEMDVEFIHDLYKGMKDICGHYKVNILGGDTVAISTHFIKAHNEPKPLIETGRIIATSRLASAMIDLSDGLLSDLGHICKESGVGAKLFRSKIPLSSELKALASLANFNPFDLALSGGEDYLLLLTVPEAKVQDIELLSKNKGPSPLYLIGEIRGGEGIRMVNDDGSVEEIGPRGFNHFIS
jgi:thiamine-monophosphate kinase